MHTHSSLSGHTRQSNLHASPIGGTMVFISLSVRVISHQYVNVDIQ